MAQTVQEIIRAGMQMQPIGTFISKRGDLKVVWPVMGGAEDDGGAGDGGAGSGTGGTGSEDQGKEGEKDGDKPDDKPAGENVTREEFEALQRRMKAADQRASAAEAKAKEYEDKDKSELEKAKGDLETVTKQRDELGETLNKMRIENAFLASNKYTWHNPARALQVVDLSGVEIQDDGKVVGLDKALDALAKSDPYLLKAEDGKEKEKPSGASGSGVGSGSKEGDGKLDKETLAKKFPALNR